MFFVFILLFFQRFPVRLMGFGGLSMIGFPLEQGFDPFPLLGSGFFFLFQTADFGLGIA